MKLIQSERVRVTKAQLLKDQAAGLAQAIELAVSELVEVGGPEQQLLSVEFELFDELEMHMPSMSNHTVLGEVTLTSKLR